MDANHATSRNRRRIAFLVNSLDSEYAQALWYAVRRAAAQHNAEVMAFTGMFVGAPDPSQATRSHIYGLVSPLRVDGVVIVSSLIAHHCGVEGIADLCRRYAPIPVCSIGLEVPGICSLVVDNRAGMAQGVRHLIEAHGCRRIAFIAAQSTSPESNLRLLGYRDALQDLGVPIDEQLIFHSDFTTPGGRAVMRQLLASGRKFDAIVAANDYMAIGALEVLSEAGVSVPGDLALCGFDDSSDAAAYRPTLTSLRQPAGWLGATAVELILEQLDGRAMQPCHTGAVDLVRRESCGCSYRVEASVRPIEGEATTVLEVLRSQKVRLGSSLLDTILDPNGALEDWPTVLLNALEAQLVEGGRIFESTLNDLLARAVDVRINLEEFQRALTQLRAELRNLAASDLDAHRNLERVWHGARMAVSAASLRLITMHRSFLMLATTLLGRTSELFSTSLSFPVLKTVVIEALPSLGIEQGAISLYENGIGSRLIPLVALQQSTECVVEERPFPAELLAPDEALHSNQPWHSIVMPLTSLEECYGICVCSGDAVPNTYEALRQQISASIRGIQLHRSMVSQVVMREKLDQQRLSTEARMAIDIQTAMLPKEISVPGLEFAHLMIPANQSGGDYYDVLTQGTSAWIAIGDVSGHGLGAGIIMLMLQCTIASAVRAHPTGKPSEILEAVNASIYDNVRHRLGRDDHATLMLMHYERDGQIALSGLHEPLLVYRAATQRCESITGPGFWIGVVPSLPESQDDLLLHLQDGDLLVMYTDGVTEPRNAHREQFGVERLAALIETLHELPVSVIRDRVVAAVRAWASNLDDDLSIVLARYHTT